MTRFICFVLTLVSAFPVIASESFAQAVTTSVVPVASLAGASPAVVADTLSAADICEDGKYGRKCSYNAGAIEIIYIGGKADWFTVYPANVFFSTSSLRQLGLPTDQNPSFETADVIRWNGIRGLHEVSAFLGDEGKVSYFYVKALTP